MNANKHEARWTYSNDKQRQNEPATLSPQYDFESFVDKPLDIDWPTLPINNSSIR